MLLVGVKKEDVKVELEEENILKISGENMKELGGGGGERGRHVASSGASGGEGS